MDDWYSPPQQDELGAELILSASSVGTYLRCPKQWEYRYVHRVRRPATVRQALGLAAHTAFESNLVAKRDSGLDLREDTVLDVFSDEYDERSHDAFNDPDDPIAKAKDQGIKAVAKQHREIAPRIYPMLVEFPFQFRINGVWFSGTGDFVDQQQRVRDWKVVARKPSGFGQYWLNQTGYVLGFRHKTGLVESATQLDIIQRHKRDDPSYYPISTDGPIPNETIALFASVLVEVHDGILAGNFPPKGLFTQSCSYCDYRDLCPAYRAAFGAPK